MAHRSSIRTVAVLAALWGAASAIMVAQASAPARADEYRLKAAIIYNLAKFVEWPASMFTDHAATFTVCVLGVDPFGPMLDNAISGHLVAGRSISARRVMAVEAGCHVVFVSESETKRLPVILDQLRGRSVLSIGEQEGFLEQGGIVSLVTEGGRVRLAVSGGAAEQAKLKVSARLLALANRPAGGAR